MSKFFTSAAAALGVLLLGGSVALAQAPQPTPDPGAPTTQSAPKAGKKKTAKKKAAKKKSKKAGATQPK